MTQDYKIPKVYKDRWRMYQRAVDILAHLRGDFVQKSEMAALHTLTMGDMDGTEIGPDFELIAQAADLARNGYEVTEEDVKKIRKSITRSKEPTYEEILARNKASQRAGDVPPDPVVRNYLRKSGPEGERHIVKT